MIKELKKQVETFSPQEKHDKYAKEAILEAIKAAEDGNFGVGAVIVDNKSGEILLKGHNRVFSDSRSDLHAEMDVMNKFENLYRSKSRDKIKDVTLYTSLECCPMCFSRLITSGIKEVFYAAKDETGGMVHLKDNMPSTWKELMKGRTFEQASCSKKLEDIAEKVFLETMSLNDKINKNKDNSDNKVEKKIEKRQSKGMQLNI